MKPPLGQHFLAAPRIAEVMAASANLHKNTSVLEIGPGKGVLTEYLLKTGASVVAVEKDGSLLPGLRERFANEIKQGTLTLIEGDILKTDLNAHSLRDGEYALVANIPYAITGEILRRFLGGNTQPAKAVLMMQKEVAERITGHPSTSSRSPKESLLSLSVKAYGTPRYIRTVKAGSFNPPPEIDSAILAIENISRSFFDTVDEQKFFTLVKKGFAHKRKTLKKNLGLSDEMFASCNISPTTRAEDLTLVDWKCLTK